MPAAKSAKGPTWTQLNYGDINESFYSSLESVYAEAIKVINATGGDVVEELRPRMAGIVRNTSGLGWGFYDMLSDLYHNDYPPEEEQ